MPMPISRLSCSLAASVVAATALLAACTTFQTVVTGPAVNAPGSAASAPAGALGPGGAASGLRPPGAPIVMALPSPLRPFADVVRDARRSDGTLNLWQKDDRVLLELKPEDFDKPFFISTKLKSGIGERNFFGGLAEDSGIIEFRRVYNQVQMIWRNVGYSARPGTPEALAVEAGYSPSLLSSAPVLSQPEPTRKSILVEANALFVADLLGLGMDLQRSYRQGYSFDPRNSAITKVRATPDIVVLEVLSHFATASITPPQSEPATGNAAALDAALAARSAQPLLHHPLFDRAPARRADGRAPRRSARRLLRERPARLQRRPAANRAPALRQPLAAREEGSGRGALGAGQADRLLDRSQRADQVPRRDHRRRARVEQGVREDRLQGRAAGRGPARGRRLRHPRPRPRLDPLDDQRLADLRRHRPEPRRPAQRRDPRRRHRHRELLGARQPVVSLAAVSERSRRRRLRRCRRIDADAAGDGAVGARLHLRRLRARGDGVCRRRARGARRARSGRPRGRGLRRRLPEVGDDARGRPHPRPAPQLPRLARLQRGAARATRRSPRSTASPPR